MRIPFRSRLLTAIIKSKEVIARKSDIVAAVKAIMIPSPVSGITSDIVTKADMKAGVASIKADMATKADVASMKANMVTKADLANMKADMKADMVTKADLASITADMVTKADMKADLASIKADMVTKADLAKMKADMKTDMKADFTTMSAGMATSSEVAKVARTLTQCRSFPGYNRSWLLKLLQETDAGRDLKVNDVETFAIFHDPDQTVSKSSTVEIDLFVESPLTIGKVTTALTTTSQIRKCIRRRDFIAKRYNMPCRAIVLAYEIDDHIADAALRLASENGIEVVVDKDDDDD